MAHSPVKNLKWNPAAAGNEALSYPDDLVGQVDSYLAELEFGEKEPVMPLTEAMRYSLLAGGKRIRPILLLATGRAYGTPPAAIMPAAAALEMIHTYSLIHDDLPAFDDDALRRGQPSCHVKFGENVAILAGDALFAEAYRLICERLETAPPVRLSVIEEISVATGVKGVVGGQLIDIMGSACDGDTLMMLHSLKTGRLISACVRCGGLLAGVTAPELTRLSGFAADLGLLFQIKDDILDVVGETAVLGKQAGADLRHKRCTYVSIYGLDESMRLAQEYRNRALEALEGLQGDTGDLAGITNYIYERQR